MAELLRAGSPLMLHNKMEVKIAVKYQEKESNLKGGLQRT
jgi:hypothetical protein